MTNSSLSQLLKNYSNARKSWEVWCYMSGLSNECKQEFRATKLQVDNSTLLSHLRSLAMKDYHIELYKVLKNTLNNKDNIFTLLEKRVRSNPKNKLEVEKALQVLNAEMKIINDHCHIRDKFYAHLDKDYEKFTSKKTYVADTGNLFHIVEMGIIALTSEEQLKKELEKIDSRDDYRISGFLQ
jgi:hypothetical protein